ncbi:hypothetical protein [Streptomyces longispororuber]|uniref:hypothetical protein n=1 Tax=Streptomyces longispororuber TaxID=68230 RepID=UPI00210DF099|nr:hypothetical protein [Streptomyces longispororuber]MCQ4206423.1 hypothetical protein [Streptomyces longispororuber]
MAGDLATSPRETLDLLTDAEALPVLRHSRDNQEVLSERDHVVWTAQDTDARSTAPPAAV